MLKYQKHKYPLSSPQQNQTDLDRLGGTGQRVLR